MGIGKYGWSRKLQHLGLTNSGTEDLGVLAMATHRIELRAYCSSAECVGRRRWCHLALKPAARPSQTYCSDCGSALVWKRERLNGNEQTRPRAAEDPAPR